jgi:hypothetical protein
MWCQLATFVTYSLLGCRVLHTALIIWAFVQAENCALELEGTDSPYTDTAALGAKMQALRQLLPGVNICDLILKDRQVLTTDIGEAAQRLILFDNLLGGPDLAELISRTPVLLYADVRLPFTGTSNN